MEQMNNGFIKYKNCTKSHKQKTYININLIYTNFISLKLVNILLLLLLLIKKDLLKEKHLKNAKKNKFDKQIHQYKLQKCLYPPLISL